MPGMACRKIGERRAAPPCWRARKREPRGIMLGRHVYRVHPTEGRWTITKEGESQPRASFAYRDEALAEARQLADADQPSKVTLDNGDGIILEEELFGRDLRQEIGA